MRLFFHHDESGGGHSHGHAHTHEHQHADRHAHEHEHGHAHDHGRGHPRTDGHGHGVVGVLGALVRRWRLLLVLAAACWACSGLRIVGPAERGIVQRFGRVIDDHVMPGIHLGLPAGIDRLTRVQMRKARRVRVGAGAADGLIGSLPDPAFSQFISGDRNIVDIQLSVQYVVSEPRAFLFACADPDAEVRSACESALCELVAAMPVDEILTLRKAEVQIRVREIAQGILDRHKLGVQVLSVSQERSAPPEKVADAFRAVTSARADRERLISEAHGYCEDLLPRARGEAESILQQAEGDAYSIVALAEGRAKRFEQVLEQAAQASDLTRRRLHAETVEDVFARVRKVIVKPGAAADLRFIEEGP